MSTLELCAWVGRAGDMRLPLKEEVARPVAWRQSGKESWGAGTKVGRAADELDGLAREQDRYNPP